MISIPYKLLMCCLSFFLVAFGQPAWLPWNGLIAAICGYAIFFRLVMEYPSWKQRFGLAFIWFFAVQLVQMSWFLSHPFWYIYSVYFFIAIWLGAQFGCIAIFFQPKFFRQEIGIFSAIGFSLFIASLWAILEWSRLYLLSGLSWNPAGLALTSNLYALQMASLWGAFGLSFWVIFVNGLGLYAWVHKGSKIIPIAVWLAAAAVPYIYGVAQLQVHDKSAQQTLTAMLVQPAFAPEELKEFSGKKGKVHHVTNEWRQILTIIKSHQSKKSDLIVLPEFVVPFGTYSTIYPLNEVMAAFTEIFQPENLNFLPEPNSPFVALQGTHQGLKLMINNAYWVQAIANYLQADVIAGLEDAEEVSPGVIEYYSAAQFTHPQTSTNADTLFTTRYAKQVLVPMGEYIPFSFCKKMAERYGIFGSFTCGQQAVIMSCKEIPFSPSICYEETYGDLMSEGRKKGANLLVNLTSDVWYPNSKLPLQHLDHARLRTVENGVPLIRACNTGITAAIDSLGRTIAILGGEHPEEVEWKPDALVVDVPISTYPTLYSIFGDKLIIGLSFLIITVMSIVYFKKM